MMFDSQAPMTVDQRLRQAPPIARRSRASAIAGVQHCRQPCQWICAHGKAAAPAAGLRHVAPACPLGRPAGGRTPAVAVRPACPHSFEAGSEPPGRKGRARRAEVARPVDWACGVRGIASGAVERCARTVAVLRSGRAVQIAAVQAEPAHCWNRQNGALARISDLERMLAERAGGCSPDGMALAAAFGAWEAPLR